MECAVIKFYDLVVLLLSNFFRLTFSLFLFYLFILEFVKGFGLFCDRGKGLFQNWNDNRCHNLDL